MIKGSELKVNPDLLRWTRESAGIEIEEVAKRLSIKQEVVKNWETGERGVTYSRLESLADYYKRPVAVFFLPQVPVETLTPTDFRAPAGQNVKVSKELRLTIRHARFVRNSYAEINPDYHPFKYKRISLSNDPEQAALKERQNLKISFEEQKGWSIGAEAYSNWVKILETAGVLVLHKSLPQEELNGFSLTDDKKPPVIVINSKDVPARKIFTLFHEYCHLLLDGGGICKINTTSKEVQRNNSVEAFCDKFAAAFLVPRDAFFAQLKLYPLNGEDNIGSIRSVANAFKVSKQVILLRLLLENKITRTFYDSQMIVFNKEFEDFLKKKKEREKLSKGGVPPYILSISQNGKTFTRAVLKAYKEGKISNKEVSSYTGVRLKHVSTMEGMV